MKISVFFLSGKVVSSELCCVKGVCNNPREPQNRNSTKDPSLLKWKATHWSDKRKEWRNNSASISWKRVSCTAAPNSITPNHFISIELIRRSHHAIVMEKQFPWRMLFTFRLAPGGGEGRGNTRCNTHQGQPFHRGNCRTFFRRSHWRHRFQPMETVLAILVKMALVVVSEKQVCWCGRQNLMLLLAVRWELIGRSHHTIATRPYVFNSIRKQFSENSKPQVKCGKIKQGRLSTGCQHVFRQSAGVFREAEDRPDAIFIIVIVIVSFSEGGPVLTLILVCALCTHFSLIADSGCDSVRPPSKCAVVFFFWGVN